MGSQQKDSPLLQDSRRVDILVFFVLVLGRRRKKKKKKTRLGDDANAKEARYVRQGFVPSTDELLEMVIEECQTK